jgi:hypothetical protein
MQRVSPKVMITATVFSSLLSCVQFAHAAPALDAAGDFAGVGRRAVAAPIYGAALAKSSAMTGERQDYLVVLNASAKLAGGVAAPAPLQALPVGAKAAMSPALNEVIGEAMGLGAAIHAVYASKGQPSFYASLDVRARDWLANHPAVAFLDANAKGASATPNVGGREFVGSAKAATNTRILINGAILGYGQVSYQQPAISVSGNMFADAASVMGAFEYSVTSNGANFEATRGTYSGGPFKVSMRSGSNVMTLSTSSGQVVTVTMPETAFAQNGRLMVPARILMERGVLASVIDWDQDTKSLQVYNYQKLDYGVYFLGVQQNSIRTDQPGAQKYIANEPNPFFDPAKPTIIYAHGWNKGSVSGRNREGLLFNIGNDWQNVQNYWITRGWNVGIFQWTQLADDDFALQPVDTEKKIYDVNSTGVGMRWKNQSSQFATRGNPTINVTQMYRGAYLQIANALASTTELRLIGNSLGGNLTVAMTRELAINGSRLPSRVTLQDPYWDPSLDANDGVTLPGGLASNRAVGIDGARRIFNAGLPLEYFRSSIAGATGYVRDVAVLSSYTNLYPDYTGDIGAKHTQPTRVYLWSYDFAGTVATPRTPVATVRSRMNTDSYWEQAKGPGSETANPSDDAYSTKTPKPQ